jgi:hypothetical protein
MVKEKYNSISMKRQGNRVKNAKKKIGVGTEYTFTGSEMSPFGGIFGVGCLVEQMGMEQLFKDVVTTDRKTEVSLPRYLLSVL